jgi:hypothetical protein
MSGMDGERLSGKTARVMLSLGLVLFAVTSLMSWSPASVGLVAVSYAGPGDLTLKEGWHTMP